MTTDTPTTQSARPKGPLTDLERSEFYLLKESGWRTWGAGHSGYLRLLVAGDIRDF